MKWAPGVWMPGLWSELECRPEDLSADFWAATKPHRQDLEKLGFTICGYLKNTRSLNPLVIEAGGIRYLHSNRRHLGQLLYTRTKFTGQTAAKHEIVISFTAAFEDGTLSCNNHIKAFDTAENETVIRLASYDAQFIYKQFLEHVQKKNQTPRQFPDVESLRQWSEARHIQSFEERVNRGLFVRMTEQEVIDAKARLQTRTATAQLSSSAKPRLSIPWALWLLIIAGIITLQAMKHHRVAGRPDTITYRGEEFHMRKAYATYEDYKDDPNNLATNEIPRIEQIMTSAKIPETFKDRKAFIEFMVYNMGFPGYGMSSFMGTTDDNSTLHIESVEIPQRDEDRVVVVREIGAQFKLVDDFVYATTTNEIARVVLEKKSLRYYDKRRNTLREKALSD